MPEDDSLETTPEDNAAPTASTSVAGNSDNSTIEGQDSQNTGEIKPVVTGSSKSSKPGGLKAFFKKFNIYLLLFVFIIIVAVMIVVIAYLHGHSQPTSPISSQTLSQNSVNQLAQSDVTVGGAKQTLNVQSNAVFAGAVLVQKDLQVAGKLQVGGSLSLTGITVTGQSVFDQIQVNKNLQVGGDTALQGQLTVQKSLSVNGGGTFNGALSAPQLSVNTLQITGDLNITHHLNAGGTTPGRTNGNALGSGGTTSVSGSDTAGSISINTGGGPTAGCFVTVTFSTKFNSTPHVIVTPIEAAAAGLQYYVTRTTSSFSVCTASAPPASQTFGFDYIIFD